MLFTIIGQRLKVLGLENLEPGKNYLVVSNYPGSYAGFALMNVFPEASIIENKSIIILPEGGRSPDGRIHMFKRGFIYILRHSSMALLPVTLRGFYSLKPMKRVYLDPDSELEVVIHKPVSHSDVKSLNDEVLLKLTVDTIEGAYKP